MKLKNGFEALVEGSTGFCRIGQDGVKHAFANNVAGIASGEYSDGRGSIGWTDTERNGWKTPFMVTGGVITFMSTEEAGGAA